MSAELPPWWAMKNDPDDWIYYQHQFSVSVSMEYSVQPSLGENAEDAQMSSVETTTMLRWLQKRMLFRRETSSMMSMIDRLQERSDQVPIDWLRILCVEKESDEDISVYDDGLDRGVSIKIGCNPDKFFELTEIEKAKWTVDTIEEACRKLLESTGIELPYILNACDQIERMHYKNEWIWGEKPSSDEKLLARVSVVQDIHKARICLEVYEAGGVLLQRAYIDDSPHLLDIWKRYLNDLEWISDRNVRLHMDRTFLEIGLEEY